MNDKHSVAPSMFRCHFHPCPYESKRESNCKQHMEKAHGWVYVRSKNNGKVGKELFIEKPPLTPQLSTPGSNIFSVPTPDFSDGANYYDTTSESLVVPSSFEPAPTLGATARYTVEDSSASFNDMFGPMEAGFPFDEQPVEYHSNGITEYSAGPHQSTWTSAANSGPSSAAIYHDQLPEDESLFGTNFDWSNMDHDLTTMNLQLITPAPSIEHRPLEAFSRNPSISQECGFSLKEQHSSFSPGAQGDAMLYSPYSMQSNEVSVDEGYSDYADELMSKPKRDFSLFDAASGPCLNNVDVGRMFDELPNCNTQIPSGWSGRGADLAQQLGMDIDIM